ncbi:MAG: leucyl/phenylalanyl-tRNA--protein transferase [Flavobacteriales bacterium]|nr:leucyl/phenylalanyl-tRNA--protein transferase [Flavobacteriales bacterium]
MVIPDVIVPTIPVAELLHAYASGRFPMCHEDGELWWHDPDPRAIFPLDRVAPNARLQRLMRSGRFHVQRVCNALDLDAVITGCADRPETWIDERIKASYVQLFQAGHLLAFEVFEGDERVGGIYGVVIGSAFFGESMFNRAPNAGKVVFHALVEHLKQSGCTLFDTQYINPFTASLGAVEVPRTEYLAMLNKAIHQASSILA